MNSYLKISVHIEHLFKVKNIIKQYFNHDIIARPILNILKHNYHVLLEWLNLLVNKLNIQKTIFAYIIRDRKVYIHAHFNMEKPDL